MSTIDKSLPNVEQEIKLPSEEEIAEASQDNIEEQVGPEDVQVEQDEDGGATITFDPEAINQPGTNEHFDKKQLHSFKHKLTKNYFQRLVQCILKLWVYLQDKKKSSQRE